MWAQACCAHVQVAPCPCSAWLVSVSQAALDGIHSMLQCTPPMQQRDSEDMRAFGLSVLPQMVGTASNAASIIAMPTLTHQRRSVQLQAAAKLAVPAWSARTLSLLCRGMCKYDHALDSTVIPLSPSNTQVQEKASAEAQ